MPQSSSPREAISANTSVEHDAEPYWAGSYPPGVTWRLPLKPRSVTGLLAGAVAKYGPQPLVSFGDATFTYDDIDRLSDRAAAGLRRLGWAPAGRSACICPTRRSTRSCSSAR
ncbi:hypothetical protein ACFQ4K_00620 [Tistrella bauzanensis]